MKTKSAKAKGRRLQDSVVKKIVEAFPHLSGNVKPAIMGEGGMDVKLYGSARDVFPYAIECKNTEKWSIPEWWTQTERNAGLENLIPCLICSKNRFGQPIVMIEIDEFIKLVKGLR